MLLKMSILKMSSNTEIREKGECAAVRAVGQGLLPLENGMHTNHKYDAETTRKVFIIRKAFIIIC
jgi:hypothetical protein